MADFNGTVLTDKGRNLLSKSLTGTTLQFTKVALGDGVWGSSVNPENLNDLVSKKIDLPINNLSITGDGTAVLRFVLTNTGLTNGFFTREIGIFATDPDLGEILYAVTYSNNPDFIPSDGVVKIENVTDIYTVVSNAQNVTAVISDTVVIATKDDVKSLSGVADSLILEKLKNVDGNGSGLDADKLDGYQSSQVFNNFRNRIINGDFKIKQRFVGEVINNNEYVIDRWKASGVTNDKFWLETPEFYSPDEGSLVNNNNPFGDSSLVAYYKLNGNANDELGKYNGTWSGTAAYDSGKFDKAGNFDGKSYIDLGTKDFHNLINTTSTFSVWVKISKYPSNSCGFLTGLGTDSSLGKWDYYFNIDNNGHIDVALESGNTDYHFTSSTKLTLGQWNYITIAFENKNIKIYLNGSLIDTFTGGFGDINTNVNDFIATSNSDVSFIGFIDQIRIFNRALTQDEVRKLYVEDSKYFFKKHLREQVVSVDSNSNITFLEQRIERQLVDDLIGGKVTLSFEISNNRNQDYKVSLLYGDGIEISNTTITTDSIDFKQYAVTFDLTNFDLSKLSNFNETGLIVKIKPSAPQVGDVVRFTNIQLEKGDKVTDFEIRSYDDELKRCMRYYEKVGLMGTSASWVDGTQVYARIPLKVEKRIKPTVTDYYFTYWTGSATNVVSINKFGYQHNSLMVNFKEPVDRDMGSSFPIGSGSYVITDAEL
jgi:hypothetical protein